MVRRKPGEFGGTYYRLYTEGLIREFDGVEVHPAPPKWGLDFNRNYPGTWAPESIQRGAGPFPASEPEIRTVVEFMYSHPNIFAAMSHHTHGGMILRSHCAKPDDKLPRADLAALKHLGEIGEQIMGYPMWSIYEEFTVDKDRPPVGSWMDWAYDLLGTLPLATELWDLQQHAGLPKHKPKEAMAMTNEQREQAQLAMLEWNDRVLAGRGFVHWRTFEHPQLGSVELGGWLPKMVSQNAPPELLEGECHKATIFTLEHAAIAPRLRIASLEAALLGDAGTEVGAGAPDRRLYKLTAVLHNQGYLPTNVTEHAKQAKLAKPLRVELKVAGSAPGALEVVGGRAELDAEHLPGHGSAAAGFGYVTPETQRKLEWVVSTVPGTVVELTVSNPKCGTARAEVRLA